MIAHGPRRILHVNVAGHPGAASVVQQLREALPFDPLPKCLLLDRDSIFSPQVPNAVKTIPAKPARTAFRCACQNPIANPFVGTARRDLLDQVVILGGRRLLRLLRDFVEPCDLTDRTHLGLAKDTPAARPSESPPSPTAKLAALPHALLRRGFQVRTKRTRWNRSEGSDARRHRLPRVRGPWWPRR
ncbi:MAG: hypothetical protein HY905_23285 [Deltaproteobacteria bacterium]|nr:hypothetical protein [Deltaproteobacteria bacterium]